MKWINHGEKEKLKHQCRKVDKFQLNKNEIYKNLWFFATNVKDIEKLKDDKRPSIQNITKKVLEKVANIKDNKKIKIKIKFKNKNDKNDYKEDKKK